MAPIVDITGRRFGRLTVLGFSHVGETRYAQWICACDCGARTVVGGDKLRRGATASCGCIRRERAALLNIKHGHARVGAITPTFVSWAAMMERCYRPTNASWEYYGGKGIKVCDRWHDFAAFLADMGERPPKMTLHRLDHTKDYEPSNCEWRKPPH